jgi:hypothetical protein
MITQLSLATLFTSLALLIFIYYYRYRIANRVFLARTTLTVTGIAISLLGFSILLDQSELVALFGAFLFVTGIQTTLWTLGIKLDALGNRELDPVGDNFINEYEGQMETKFISIAPPWHKLEELEEFHRFIENTHIELKTNDDGSWTREFLKRANHLSLDANTYETIQTIINLKEQIKWRSRLSGESNVQQQNELADALAKLQLVILSMLEVYA